MLITKTSILSGKSHTREIDIDPQRLASWENDPEMSLIQVAFPGLSDDDREFILTGITPEEWDAMVGDEDDEDDEDVPF